MVDPDQHLAYLSRRKVAVGHDFLSDGSLEEQAAGAEVSELRATAYSSCW
jgi:hypothetical protein